MARSTQRTEARQNRGSGNGYNDNYKNSPLWEGLAREAEEKARLSDPDYVPEPISDDVVYINIDMDGVTHNWNDAVLQKWLEINPDKPMSYFSLTKHEGFVGFITEHCQTTEFFETLPTMGDTFYMNQILAKIRGNKKFIARFLSASGTTNPDVHNAIALGKENALKKIGTINELIVVNSSHEKSSHCANKHDVLIDDYKVNCKGWHEMDGQAIQHINWVETIKQLKILFPELK